MQNGHLNNLHYSPFPIVLCLPLPSEEGLYFSSAPLQLVLTMHDQMMTKTSHYKIRKIEIKSEHYNFKYNSLHIPQFLICYFPS